MSSNLISFLHFILPYKVTSRFSAVAWQPPKFRCFDYRHCWSTWKHCQGCEDPNLWSHNCGCHLEPKWRNKIAKWSKVSFLFDPFVHPIDSLLVRSEDGEVSTEASDLKALMEKRDQVLLTVRCYSWLENQSHVGTQWIKYYNWARLGPMWWPSLAFVRLTLRDPPLRFWQSQMFCGCFALHLQRETCWHDSSFDLCGEPHVCFKK